ncbi:MAG: glycosyltransferase family 2 protein [Candidatus Veblenbacteria bacterium]|nr:glycosyltransferase family 2 protein [Candidatus Veblenbacteria bacterium]
MIRWLLNRLPQKTVYRVFEIIPGLLVWGTLVGSVVLSFLQPLWAIYVIILFDLYWLLRVSYLLVYLIIGWQRFRWTLRQSWLPKVEALPRFKDIYHIIFLPTYREPLEVLRSSLQSLAAVNYPTERFMVVLAGEERDRANFEQHARTLQAEFGSSFGHFLVTIHPANIVGELAGKGANINWAGHRAQEYIDRLGLTYEDIIVSSFDVDSCPHPDYFAHLTYSYLTHPDPLHTSFQPVAVYNNNIWDSPSLMRVIANSTTFWLFTDLARPERLFTFSSHSMPFRALVDVGFWQNDIVTEDSRIFLQCFVHYDGHYRVTPLYLPVSMDTVYSGSFWRSLVNQYKQQRRWAYGVENFAYMAYHFWRSNRIPFNTKFRYVWNQLEGMYSWATAPIIIFILGRLPLMLADTQTKTTLLAHSAPVALQWLMTVAMVGLVFSAILSSIMLPPRPRKYHWLKYVGMITQWLLFPISMIAFGAVPAIEAQTRLMLGKYLGFWVTEKQRDQTTLSSTKG